MSPRCSVSGIEVKAGDDLVKVLEDRFGGMAAGALTDAERATLRISRAFENLKVSIGNAVLAGAQQSGSADAMSASIKDLTKWIVTNQEALSETVKVMSSLASAVIPFLVKEFVQLGDTIKVRVLGEIVNLTRAFTKFYEVVINGRELMADLDARVFGEENPIVKQQREQIKAWREQIQAMKDWVTEHQKAVTESQHRLAGVGQPGNRLLEGSRPGGLPGAPGAGGPDTAVIEARTAAAEAGAKKVREAFEKLGQDIEQITANATEAAVMATTRALADLVKRFESLPEEFRKRAEPGFKAAIARLQTQIAAGIFGRFPEAV